MAELDVIWFVAAVLLLAGWLASEFSEVRLLRIGLGCLLASILMFVCIYTRIVTPFNERARLSFPMKRLLTELRTKAEAGDCEAVKQAIVTADDAFDPKKMSAPKALDAAVEKIQKSRSQKLDDEPTPETK